MLWIQRTACLLVPALVAASCASIPTPQAQTATTAPSTTEELHALLTPGSPALPLISAHRGGAGPGLPENCIATFEQTAQTGFALIEVDPRLTRDGIIVLHHDPTLERTTSGQGLLADHTYAELHALRLKDLDGHLTQESIPTLEEALRWAQGRAVLVLDSKDVSVQQRVAAITELQAEAYAMMLIYSIADAQECYRLNPRIMMEVAITNPKQFEQFDRSGVPWTNIVAFVGHTPPTDHPLLSAIHEKGACCMAGTSRNLDRDLADADEAAKAKLAQEYQALIEFGVDIIETDLPRQLRPLIQPPS
ncbi:MAG: glycerophosphodiester phosphodiesterase family protein [Verrucomicrobiota bacterium]|nr:glycerophosphodiester phosphodiesterase family protein [Verrucomicrobiota bacterium]